jgi:hypothetical protein
MLRAHLQSGGRYARAVTAPSLQWTASPDCSVMTTLLSWSAGSEKCIQCIGWSGQGGAARCWVCRAWRGPGRSTACSWVPAREAAKAAAALGECTGRGLQSVLSRLDSAACGGGIIQIHRRQRCHQQRARLPSHLLCAFARSRWRAESGHVCTKPLHVASRHPILLVDVAPIRCGQTLEMPASMHITLAQVLTPFPPPHTHTPHRGPHGNAPAHRQPQACQENVHSSQGVNGAEFCATPALCVLQK